MEIVSGDTKLGSRGDSVIVRVTFSLCSHLKEFLGNGVRTHVNSKGKIPSTRGSEDGQTCDCIMQDSEPNTLPTELFQLTSSTHLLEALIQTLTESYQ